MSRTSHARHRHLLRLALGVATIVGCAHVAHAEDVKIAVIADLSSPNSIGPTIALAVQAALEAARASHALAYKVELVVSDDQCKPEIAVTRAAEMVERGVSLVIGHSCPTSSFVAAERYRNYHILQIDPATTDPLLSERSRGQAGSYLFRVAERQDRAATIAVSALTREMAGKNICVVGGLAQQKWLDRFRGLASQNAKSFRVAESIPNSTGGDDICIVYDPYNRSGLARQQGRQDIISITGPEVASASPLGSPDALRALERKVRDTGYTATLSPAINAYAAVQIWIKARDEARTGEAARIADVMHRRTFDTVRGRISFDEIGDVRQPLITLVRMSRPEIQVPNECNEPKCSNCACTGCCSK